MFSLAALEEQNRDLTEIEVNEMSGLVRHVGAEVSSDDAVPGRVVLLVELLLDVGGDVLLDVVLLQRLGGAVDSILKREDKIVEMLELVQPNIVLN